MDCPALSPDEKNDPVIQTSDVSVYHGDAVAVLPRLPASSVDSLVTDPPYAISFNGHSWDGAEGFRESLTDIDTTGMSDAEVFEAWCAAWGRGALHVLKPGGYVAAFGGSRTWHRMVRGLEDAGFEVRDQIAWLYSSGMPKSLDISHALDKHSGTRRHDRVVEAAGGEGVLGVTRRVQEKGSPVTPAARAWEGWGTALRPSFEPIILARKPLAGTVAENVVEHGVGGLNIEACRSDGRWPANVVLDETQADALDVLTGSWQGTSVSRRFPIFRYESKPGRGERPRAYGVSHSTVKPLGLMRWLVTLVTPPGGLVVEPFAGSGTTIEAAVSSGFRVLAIEKDADYLPLIEARLDRLLESDLPASQGEGSGPDRGRLPEF